MRCMWKKYRHSSKPCGGQQVVGADVRADRAGVTSPSTSGCRRSACASPARRMIQGSSAAPSPRPRHSECHRSPGSDPVHVDHVRPPPHRCVPDHRAVGPEPDRMPSRRPARIAEFLDQVVGVVVLAFLVDLLLGRQRLGPRPPRPLCRSAARRCTSRHPSKVPMSATVGGNRGQASQLAGPADQPSWRQSHSTASG